MNFKLSDTIKIAEYTLKELFRKLRDISISTHGVFLILRLGEYNENFTRVGPNWKKATFIFFSLEFSNTLEINYRKEEKSTKQ